MTAGTLELIIFHYHLLPGGVTDVIRHSLAPLGSSSRIKSVKIICGRNENMQKMSEAVQKLAERGMSIPMELVVFPEMDYLNHQEDRTDTQKMKKLLQNRFSSPESVWLIHNYHLGKNWIFTAALNEIAREGHQKMIYQIHDFPECARFTNLNALRSNIEGSLYPLSKNLRYCVINMRDFNILKDSGLPESSLFLLENPLPQSANPASRPVDGRELKRKLKSLSPEKSVFHPEGDLWLYPVRSIRRKNVLEGGLITALIDEPVNLILTLPGISPQEKKYSDLCEKAFSEGLIPGFWGTGVLEDEEGVGFSDLISASNLIFSSSVQEGFGYMYLNALLWKKPLLARYLDIMDGFLPLMDAYPARLYKSVLIPGDKKLRQSLEKEYLLKYQDLESYLPESVKKRLMEDLYTIFSSETVDFSYLSPQMQYDFLSKARSQSFLTECREVNQNLIEEIRKLKAIAPAERGAHLKDGYGEKAYAKAFSRILDSFDQPFERPAGDEKKVDMSLLQRFSKSEFFRLLYN